MKKILLLLLLIFSFTTFADDDVSFNEDTEVEDEIYVENPDPIALDLNVNLVGKRFRVKNDNVPMTLDYNQMRALLQDLEKSVSPELLDLRVYVWQKKHIGGVLLKGTPVEVVEDLREKGSEIVKVKVVGDDDFLFYLWAYTLNKFD